MSKKILYFDCFAGISGDMTVGAMIELVGEDNFRAELSKLKFHPFSIDVMTVLKNGIKGTQFIVHDLESTAKKDNHSYSLFHESGHHHGNNHNHSHDHHHQHSHEHNHSHLEINSPVKAAEKKDDYSVHRNIRDIETIIKESDLNENVKNTSLKIFNIIAEAEAKIHNKDVKEIHFHEVGAVDSIIDIVSFSICFELLHPDVVKASPVNLGDGFVKCAHGLLPVPAPAVLEISGGIPVYKSESDCELTTPTGIAILKAVVNNFDPNVKLIPEKVGYGAGSRNCEFPNLLRVIFGTEM